MSSHSYIHNSKNENIYININGELFSRDKAKISVFDSGFLLGDGVWEGIRLHKSKLVFIEEHINRLFASAKGISLDIPLSRQDIVDELIRREYKVHVIDNLSTGRLDNLPINNQNLHFH